MIKKKEIKLYNYIVIKGKFENYRYREYIRIKSHIYYVTSVIVLDEETLRLHINDYIGSVLTIWPKNIELDELIEFNFTQIANPFEDELKEILEKNLYTSDEKAPTMTDLINGYIEWFNSTTEEERIIDAYSNCTELSLNQLLDEGLTFKQANQIMKARNKQ